MPNNNSGASSKRLRKCMGGQETAVRRQTGDRRRQAGGRKQATGVKAWVSSARNAGRGAEHSVEFDHGKIHLLCCLLFSTRCRSPPVFHLVLPVSRLPDILQRMLVEDI